MSYDLSNSSQLNVENNPGYIDGFKESFSGPLEIPERITIKKDLFGSRDVHERLLSPKDGISPKSTTLSKEDLFLETKHHNLSPLTVASLTTPTTSTTPIASTTPTTPNTPTILIEKDTKFEETFHCLPSKNSVFWAYIFIMVGVAVILYAMIFTPRAFRHGGAGENLPHPDLNSVIWAILLFIFAYVGYTGYFKAHNARQRNIGNMIMGLILLMIIILGFVQYRQRDLTNACIAAIIFGALVGWWILHMWDIDRVAAYLLFIPFAWAIHISISLYVARGRVDKNKQIIGQGVFG